jgi:response regulator RpfG family c-di-GMP phosphodiesterase
MVTAERLMMQETLVGCIQALTDVLAMTNPVAFGRASRLKRLAMRFAEAMDCDGFWQLEAATMLSQLGYVSLPVELVEKLYYGEKLTPEEVTLSEGVPQVADKLLGHIPRLEPVLQILNAVTASDQQLARLGDGTIGLGARILAITLHYDTLVAQGHGSAEAVQTVRQKSERYGTTLVEKFATLVGVGASVDEIRELPLRMVQPGMTIMNDLRTHQGTLLVARGFEVSESFLQRLHNFGSGILEERVKVVVHAPKAVA